VESLDYDKKSGGDGGRREGMRLFEKSNFQELGNKQTKKEEEKKRKKEEGGIMQRGPQEEGPPGQVGRGLKTIIKEEKRKKR